MTRQEAMNVACKGLAAQDWERSVDSGGQCLYRGPHGRKCFIGHLIDDDADVAEAAVTEALLQSVGLLPEDLMFAQRCQRAHDSSRSASDMQSWLRLVCEQYELTQPPELVQ